ncbi:MAG TPA: carboxypeptidase-like regulatory domain-containing protein, partial [Thermoanaerobaculia bacterium]
MRNDRRCPRLFVFFAVCVALLPALATAQVITGTLLGTVTDQSGAPLPGVSITVKNQDTGQTRTIMTDSGGGYRAPGLSLGPYEVRAELEGFQVTLRRGITLTVGREAVVNFKLQLARVSETLVVQAEAPLVNTTESMVSHLVDELKIRELP